jgi:hypothetical protein
MKRPSILLVLLLAACSSSPAKPGEIPEILELKVKAGPDVWVTGAQLRLQAVVTRAGKADPAAAVTFSADPTTAATPGTQEGQEASFTLAAAGPVTFRACLADAPDRCDTLEGSVDDGSPRLTVTTPAPGEEIDDPAGVVVRGTVEDGTGAVQLTVNGVAVTPDADGKFETTLPPRFGVEHLEVVANDAVSEPARVELDVLHATSFRAAKGEDGKPSYTQDAAAGVWLGQDFFDDGMALDRSKVPLTTHDLADIVELVAAGFSLDGLLPDPLFTGPGIDMHVTGSRLGPAGVEMVLQDGGVDVFVHLAEVELDTAGTLSIGGQNHSLAGKVLGGATIHATLVPAKASPDVDATVEVRDAGVTLGAVQGNFEDPAVGALFQLTGGSLRSSIESSVQDGILGLLDGTLPSLLLVLLDGVDHALKDTTLQVGTPPVTLAIDGRMSSVAVTHRGALTAPLVVTMSTSVEDKHPGSRGVARMTSGDDPLDFATDGQVQIAVNAGFVNGLMHVLWSSGMLDLDLKALVPAAAALVDSGSIQPRLPPVLRPARTGEEGHPLVLSVGQMEVEVLVGGATLRFGVNIDVGADLALSDGKLSITLAPKPTVRSWIIQGDPSIQLDPSVVKGAITLAWPDLSAALGGLVAIDLPLVPAGSLGALSPELAGLELQLASTDAGLQVRGETLVIPATITGTVK